MGRFFNRERFGNAQLAAGLLLVVFMAECSWLVAHEPRMGRSQDALARVQAGTAQWRGDGIAGTPAYAEGRRTFDPEHSPLWYLIAAAPIAYTNASPDSQLWFWLTRAPYIAFGMLLGASLWYVSRRLYGNAGGFIGLGLYCFSPAVVRATTLWFTQPQIGAAWGAFGAVFTAIAVSHTLYAPREVVLWNWRRTLLLGISLALAVGSHFALAIVIPVLLAFMMYLAPDRKLAAFSILAAACIVGLLILFAAYFFHVGLFWHGLLEAKFLDVTWHAFEMGGAYLQLRNEIIAAGPVMVLLVPAAFFAFAFWKRCRYFGNTAPLLVAILFAVLRVGCPHTPDSVLSLAATIFLFVFVAGILADMLETRYQERVAALIVGILAANAVWDVVGLLRIGF